MTPRSARQALAGAFGVVIGLIGVVAIAAASLVALGVPAPSRADDGAPAEAPGTPPSTLVVALDLADPVRQAGAVKGRDVLLARGFEVDVARQVARRLRIPAVRFVFVRPAARLLVANAPSWHLGIASLTAASSATRNADLSDPYLSTDQAVVLRRGLPRLRSLDELRRLRVCALRGSDGARVLSGVVRSSAPSVLAPSSERLFVLVQTGVCDAALVSADAVGRFVAGRGGLVGPVSARVPSGSGYVIAVPRGAPVSAVDVSRALRLLRADGTLHRIARAWLQIDPARLRVLG